jgi:hypothetical protein
MSALDAYQYLSQAVEAPLANVVDTNYTSVAKLRKDWLPVGRAGTGQLMNGMHDHLRAVARTYRGD